MNNVKSMFGIQRVKVCTRDGGVCVQQPIFFFFLDFSGVSVIVLHIPVSSPTLGATAPTEALRLLLLPPVAFTQASLSSLEHRLSFEYSHSEGTLDILLLLPHWFCAVL